MPRILGLGTAVPPHRIAQRDAADFAVARCAEQPRHAKLMPTLFERTTVQQRGSVLLKTNGRDAIDHDSSAWFFPEPTNGQRGPGTSARMRAYKQYAPPLAEAACSQALNDARVQADQITHLITVSCTGFAAPGVEQQLIRGLSLSGSVTRTQIGFMGCHGAMNGLQVARAFAASDPAARVLMVCVELCSLHMQYGWHAERVVANALFADGAAAVVVGQDESKSDWRVRDTASRLFDDSDDAMTWHVGDHGFEMTLSPRVPALISEHVRSWVEGWLVGHDLTVEQIGSFAIHPGGPRVVSSVAQALDLSEADVADSRHVLQSRGNMSSATLLFIVQRLREKGAKLPCVAMSFGPGLVAEAVLLDAADA